MRKSRKYSSKKTNKFSRKNKKTQKGGMTEDHGGYILVGFFKGGPGVPLEMPLFLERNKIGEGENDIRRIIPYGYKNCVVKIILPQLYKTKLRNLDLFVFDSHGTVLLLDDENNTIINAPTMSQRRNEEEKKRYINENKDKIKQIELNYPGLFQRIVITEEEERNALEELIKKEPKIILPDENNDISEEQKQTIHPEEIEFMEFTNRITPFLRNDLKKNRKNKISRKKIADTNITIGSVYN